jgi:hypothetical protein
LSFKRARRPPNFFRRKTLPFTPKPNSTPDGSKLLQLSFIDRSCPELNPGLIRAMGHSESSFRIFYNPGLHLFCRYLNNFLIFQQVFGGNYVVIMAFHHLLVSHSRQSN